MTKIKICGLKRDIDIRYANETKPDYAGFVFAKGSKRQIDFKTALRFRGALNRDILAVGVFANESIDNIVGLLRDGAIDIVQLHGDESVDYMRELKDKFNAPIIKAVKITSNSWSLCPNVHLEPLDFLLFDSAQGGSGRTFDWNIIKDYKNPFFLAGGINIQNIEKALCKLNPFCIDISGGVETDGFKDLEKMREIIRTVRQYREA